MPRHVVWSQPAEIHRPVLALLDQAGFEAGAAEEPALQLRRVRLVEVKAAEDGTRLVLVLLERAAQDAPDLRVEADLLRLAALLVQLAPRPLPRVGADLLDARPAR